MDHEKEVFRDIQWVQLALEPPWVQTSSYNSCYSLLNFRTLDSEMQTLVYENYNKFIVASDTICKVRLNLLGRILDFERPSNCRFSYPDERRLPKNGLRDAETGRNYAWNHVRFFDGVFCPEGEEEMTTFLIHFSLLSDNSKQVLYWTQFAC